MEVGSERSDEMTVASEAERGVVEAQRVIDVLRPSNDLEVAVRFANVVLHGVAEIDDDPANAVGCAYLRSYAETLLSGSSGSQTELDIDRSE